MIGTENVYIISNLESHLLRGVNGLALEPSLPELDDSFDLSMA